MHRTDLQPTNPGSLCTQCALCCNGVLFVDVRLGASERTDTLSACGVQILKRRGSESRFRQPCACLQNRQCKVYDSRPTQCRTFECRVLLRMSAGEIPASEALRVIRSMQRRVQRVNRLLLQLGQSDTELPLATRYSRLMRTPMDLQGDPDGAERRGQLMMEMHRLMMSVQRDFLAIGGVSK